jgi:branched-chain amino acid transport system permease protein
VQLTQAIISGIQIGPIYALVAVGLTIIWGLMGMINFAHGELMMWGMFAAWSLSFFFTLDPIVTMVPIGFAAYVIGAGPLVRRTGARSAARRSPPGGIAPSWRTRHGNASDA